MKDTLQSIVILSAIIVLLVSGRPSNNITRVYGKVTSTPTRQKAFIKVTGNVAKVNKMIKNGWFLIEVEGRGTTNNEFDTFYLVKY